MKDTFFVVPLDTIYSLQTFTWSIQINAEEWKQYYCWALWRRKRNIHDNKMRPHNTIKIISFKSNLCLLERKEFKF